MANIVEHLLFFFLFSLGSVHPLLLNFPLLIAREQKKKKEGEDETGSGSKSSEKRLNR